MRSLFLMTLLFFWQSVMAWEGSGTEASPWLVRTASDWQQIDTNLKNGADFTGKFFRLDNDLEINSCIGTDEAHPFTGTFDGSGYTLTIRITTDEDAMGAFAAIKGATIRGFRANGMLVAGVCSGGLVGKVMGTGNLVEDCYVKVDLNLKGNSTNGSHGGGIVGHGKQSGLTIRGCVYDGHMYAMKYDDSYLGAILGWCDATDGITVTDCMGCGTYSGKNLGVNFYVNGSATAVKTTNCYYLSMYQLSGTKKALKVTAEEAFDIDFGTPTSTYPVAGIKAYSTGFYWNGTFYAGESDVVNFKLTVKDGFSIAQFPTTTSGTLTSNGEGMTLVMGGGDAHIGGTITTTHDFEGNGTNESPYLVTSTEDWYLFAKKVAEGNSFKGKVLRMTTDIDANGIIVGDEEHTFQGTFDGDGHTLTLNLGGGVNWEYLEYPCAPFRCLEGATIRHLHTTGIVYTKVKYTGGIASTVLGSTPSTLYDCSSDFRIESDQALSSDATHGGLIGIVESGGCLLEECTFTGHLSGHSTCSAGFVGWTNVPLTFKHCLYDPKEQTPQSGCATFVRQASVVNSTFEECYCTRYLGTEQGKIVFNRIILPEGSTYEMEGEPTVKVGGKRYWENGAYVHITAPKNASFNHWRGTCYLSDPWNRDGRHQLLDVKYQPDFYIETTMPDPVAKKTVKGAVYRYLSRDDYYFYVSDEQCQARGWYVNGDNYLVAKDKDNDEYYITAIVDFDANQLDQSLVGGFWGLSMEYEGSVFVNDLVNDLRHHTHLGVVAPRAFKGCSALEKVIFISDDDAMYYQNLLGMDLIIGEEAFANCPNLREFTMMYYNYTGTDHWETIAPTGITAASNAFDDSSNCVIYVDPTHFQGYLSSSAWTPHEQRIGLYMYTEDDFNVHGAVYSYMRDSNGDAVKNNAAGHEVMMNTLKYWNASYQQFSAEDLLVKQDYKNIWYAQVVGADNSYLESNNGVMRIYNDPGSQYIYKTVAVKSGAFKDNKNLKAVEFYQTNGLSDNSYSDLKIVIQNGAFQGCSNLKELRMFYHVEDGTDHWEVLGPEDVIPGNNIFGLPSAGEIETMSYEQLRNRYRMPEDFRILVYTERYKEFLDDPNWAPYIGYIEPVDYLSVEEVNGDDASFQISDHKGITYGYMVSPGSIRQASATVSQDVSWWTVSRLGIEAALVLFGDANLTWAWYFTRVPLDVQAANRLAEVFGWAVQSLVISDGVIGTLQSYDIIIKQSMYDLAHAPTSTEGHTNAVRKAIFSFVSSDYGKQDNFKKLPDNLRQPLFNKGLIDSSGRWKATEAEMTTFLSDENNMAWMERIFVDVLNYFCSDIASNLSLQQAQYTATQKSIRTTLSKTSNMFAKQDVWNALPYACKQAANSAYFAASTWGGRGHYDSDALNKAVRDNVLSNIHQVGLVGGGLVITTPQKNLVYHTYVKEVNDTVTHAVIHAGTDDDQGKNASARTMAFGKYSFRNKKNLQYVSFFENNVTTNEAIPMVLTIPDSAFVGCDNLKEISLILNTDGNGTQALGPESFILAGDNVFAGLEPEKFRIVIDPSRKEDFLNNDSWAPLEKYFSYSEAKPEEQYNEYGCRYTYAYEYGSVQRVNKVNGHKVEHTVVIGPDNGFIDNHKGAIKLCNDIGSYNNYQLDAVYHGAFKNNQNLRRVLFTDLYGSTGFGDVYTSLDVTLEDSCFAGCSNLGSIDLVYLVTDGKNHFTPITPKMLKIGSGVLDGTNARLKMMPQQVAWFEADSAWVQYRDRFMPCIIQPVDEEVKDALEFLTFTDDAATKTDDSEWDDYIDLSRLATIGDNYDFGKLDGKFTEVKDDLRSFPDFKYFEALGMKKVHESWFEGCYKLSNILLPGTITSIERRAFKGCSALIEIDIPESVNEINSEAFSGCTALKSIYVHKKTPFSLYGSPLPKNSGMRIYVPDASVQTYKQKWAEYAEYIFGESERPVVGKVVTVTEPGQLASRLGLSPVKESSKIRYLNGLYAQYDSLTVIGPLNGDDLAVLRHLAGADAYDSAPTDGRLVYLNLWNANIRKDSEHSYNGNGSDEYIDADNKVPNYLFENCTALQTIILPKTATYIGENIFEDATGLRRVVVGLNTTEYECDILQSLEGIEDLALITNSHATSTYSDPWEADIAQAYVPKSLLGDYLGDQYLTRRAHSVISLFGDDAVWKALANKGYFFPDEYAPLTSADDIFTGNTDIKTFDDFYIMENVKALGNTFNGCSSMESIALPEHLEQISADAFAGCRSLATIHVSCDNVPELEADAFEDLPADFRILVPKNLCMLYREKWAQYADHINADKSYYSDNDVIVVTTKAPNTLGEELGLTVTTDTNSLYSFKPWVTGVSGDYSKITKIKVIGPISSLDFDVMRYLAGYCPWIKERNYAGHLEYIDLYDAQLVETSTAIRGEDNAFEGHKPKATHVKDNTLPYHAFLKAYSLKTLILPKTCTEVEARAMQECSNLEVLVLGDDLDDFNWNALDDNVSLTRMYILANKVVNISSQFPVWRWLCNNYNPTFDAFYVKPSLLEQYRSNSDYTSSSWHRTNNIQKGVFDEDDGFKAFAAHAAATEDDLGTVYDVKGWFDNFTNITDLTALGFTAIDSLRTEDMAPLAKLEKIVLPSTVNYIGKNALNQGKLRYVDMLMANADLVEGMKGGLRDNLGLNPYALAYVPVAYGETEEPNVVWSNGTGLRTNHYKLNDSWDYNVPYAFTAKQVSNTRMLLPRNGYDEPKYTVFLPYGMAIPENAKGYQLTKREGTTLVFDQVDALRPFTPYLLVIGTRTVSLDTDEEQQVLTSSQAAGTLGQSQIDVVSYSMRGTLSNIDNKRAASMGAYILQEDNLWHPVKSTEGHTAATIPPFRTYILPNGGATGVNAFSMQLNDETDGVDSILTIDNDGTERWYDLNGRELPGKPQRGIYIHNGQKHLVK